MKSIYQDEWTRWHHKPCAEGKPSSNNGWIYSAYAEKLGFTTDKEKLKECFNLCLQPNGVIYRSPGKELPPNSRDEILGMFWLGIITTDFLEKRDWSFSPAPSPAFNPIKTVAAASRILYAKSRVFLSEKGIMTCTLGHINKAHRNAIWKGEGEPHLHRLAFSVPVQDRVYMLRAEGKKVPLSWGIYEKISSKVSSKSASGILINWRKGKEKLTREALVHEFGEDHEFTKAFISPA